MHFWAPLPRCDKMDIYNDKEHKRNGYWRREAAKTKKMAARARQEASRSSTRIDDLEQKIETMGAKMTSMATNLDKLLGLAHGEANKTKNMVAEATNEAGMARIATLTLTTQIKELQQKVDTVEAETISTMANKTKNKVARAFERVERVDGQIYEF